jgi:hypothetical protein
MNHAATCGAAGPLARVSATYERQLFCNRVVGHPDEHREYNAVTFRIVGAWTKATEPIEQPSGRRKVRDNAE